ncbi:M12 family metallopeptidase [Streptomyces sp. NPDC005271]|uniref:M12 family metallopeptidase n=1 Tax=unclassified Streptomyces TaxID=2593676 RepID=UPI0033AC7A92
MQRAPADAARFPDFVRFVPGDGCSSSVGRQGGMQSITLGPDCTAGKAIHEVGHTVGLWHEQSREDSDQFVTIVFTNIDPELQHNFVQHISDGDDLGAYDYASIMHYSPNAFSINGEATIVARQTLPAGVVMGQREALSQGDIDAVHALYPLSVFTIKEVVHDPTVKEGPKDPVQDGTIKEVVHESTIKGVAKDPVSDQAHVKPSGLDLQHPGFGNPFVLATPHQSPALGQHRGTGDFRPSSTAGLTTARRGSPGRRATG